MSTGRPAKCTGMMARVLAVIAARRVDIQIARMKIDIHEDRLGANARDDVCAGGKAHRRHDHLVAVAYSGDLERHFEARRRRSHHPDVASRSQVGRSAASNACTFGPLANCPERNTSATAAMLSASMDGRVNGRRAS